MDLPIDENATLRKAEGQLTGIGAATDEARSKLRSRCHYVLGAFLGCDCVERRESLFDIVAAADGARDVSFLIFGKCQRFGESLGADMAEVFVLRHNPSREESTIRLIESGIN
jgi:hypothetical protein